MKIIRLRKANKKSLKDINRLLAELSPESVQITLSFLNKLIKDKKVFLLVAIDNNHIIGMASLITAMSPTNIFGLIEDVVVDEKYRGKGLGRMLVERLIKQGKRQKLAQLKLTSKKDRVAANNLYKKLGFVLKETNSYRLKLRQQSALTDL